MAFDVKSKIIALYGTSNICGKNESLISLWDSWYKGYHDKFHNYRIYNGENYIYLTKKSLQMGKKICEVWADLLINEKCDISASDETKRDLDILFDETKFWSKANKAVELGFALGFSALLGEISQDKKMRIVLLSAKNIMPLRVDNETIVDCAFYRQLNTGTRITIWKLTDNGYHITTVDYSKDGKEIDGTRTELKTNIKIPLFMIIRPNIVSNMDDIEYNFGMSIFANSIDTLKAIDTKYDGFDFEFIGGRKKVYVSMDAMKVIMSQDGTSTQVKPFDPLDSTYYNVGDGDKPMVQEAGGELRSTQYIEALNFELGILSEKTGLGYGYFRFDSKGLSTATQVISENSDLFRTLKKHEILIRDEFIEFVKAIIEYSNAFCEFKIAKNEDEDAIDILFDDSIIEDKQGERQNDLIQVQNGLMTYVDYAIKWEALSEDDAKKKYLYLDVSHKANTLMPLLHANLITPDLAIKLIYGEEDNVPEIDIEALIKHCETDPLDIDDGEFDDGLGGGGF